MKIWLSTLAILVAAAAQTPSVARAADIDIRCNNDSLSPDQARARLEWARACGLKKNVQNPFPANPLKREDTGIPSPSGGTLIEFKEDFSSSNFWSQNTYTSVSVNFQVNNTYVEKQYSIGGTYQNLDPLGFEKWSRLASKLIDRPMYPTFGSHSSPSSGVALYPHEHLNPNDCNIYTSRNGGVSQGTFFINGYCTSSCYTPEQKVLFPDGEKEIVEAIRSLDPEMITLTPDSTLNNVTLQSNQVKTYTTELYDTTHIIFEIKTASGGLLRVTDEHPIIQGEGRIVQAKTLKVGDELVTVDGALDAIVSIDRTEHFGKVYNLKPATRDRVSNILVAQGYLVGSSAYQNEDVDYINRIIMFRSIPEDVIHR